MVKEGYTKKESYVGNRAKAADKVKLYRSKDKKAYIVPIERSDGKVVYEVHVKKSRKKNRALFDNRVYDKEGKYFKTKAEAQKRIKSMKDAGFYAVLDKRKEGWFMWYQRSNERKKAEERKILRNAGVKRGTIIHDLRFNIKFKVVGAYDAGSGASSQPTFETVKLGDERLSIGSLSASVLKNKKSGYKIIKKK